MTDSQWLTELADAFELDGAVGGRILPLLTAENSHAATITNTYHGYQIISDSFFALFMETVNLVAESFSTSPVDKWPTWYREIWLTFATTFRSFRASEKTFSIGYPLVGFGLLRDIKDRALLFGAIANGTTDFTKSQGYGLAVAHNEPLSSADEKAMKSARIKEERRVFKLMVGSKSGLKEQTRQGFFDWENLFHLEVHGGRFTNANEVNKLGIFTLLPMPNSVPNQMFINTSNSIKWMWTRLLPFLQLSQGMFGTQWENRWSILDNALLQANQEWGRVQEGDLPGVIHEVVTNKFPHTPGTLIFREQPKGHPIK